MAGGGLQWWMVAIVVAIGEAVLVVVAIGALIIMVLPVKQTHLGPSLFFM